MAKKSNNLTELKNQIKEKKLSDIYVFYGEEEYLKELYIKKIFELVPDGGLEEFNRIILDGAVDYDEYDNAWEGLPMMAEKRILMIRDSNIFTIARSKSVTPPTEEQRAFWTEKLKNPPEDTVVIFCEKNVDGRSALFKAASKKGLAVNFEFQSVTELKSWVIKRTLKAGKKIDDKTAEYLVSVIDKGLNNLESELNKLLNFCGDIIYKSDVDRVVSKAVEIRVFELIDGINEGNVTKVMDILNDLRTQNQSAFGTLYLIYSNVEKMLHLRLAKVASSAEAARLVGGSPWMAQRYITGARGFSTEALYKMVTRVPEIDYEIKSGIISERRALEQYVFEIMNMKKV